MNEQEMKTLFSQRLQLLLAEHELNQNDLSEILGVDKSTVGKWILQKSMPRMGIIQKLSDHFNIEKSFFLEEHIEDSLLPVFQVSANEKDFIKKYRGLNSEGKIKLASYLDDLLDLPKYTEKESKAGKAM